MQTICLHPNIIINPLASELIAQYGNYTIKGKKFLLSQYRNLLYDVKIKNLSPYRNQISHDDLESCFITNFTTFENFPLYLEVPCGHCEVCKSSKVNAFVHRCKLESLQYDCQPIFITLTYDELHKKECGVCLRDVQLFFKRLRINLYRKGYRQKIRYVLVAEYGKRTYRPHYHALLWNVRQTDLLTYREIRGIIEKSWSNGFVMQRLVDAGNDKTFYYTSKYLCKDSDHSNGRNKTFMVSSNRGGGIGAAFIDTLAGHFEKHLNKHCKYVNKFNGKVEELQLNRYILNRCLPSFCRSLPPSLKSHVRRFLLNYSQLSNRNNVNREIFDEKAVQIIDFFGSYFYTPLLASAEIKASLERPTPTLLREMLEDEIAIDRAVNKGREYYDRAVFRDKRRKVFLNVLFANQQDIDLKDRAYQFRRMSEMAAQREIF